MRVVACALLLVGVPIGIGLLFPCYAYKPIGRGVPTNVVVPNMPIQDQTLLGLAVSGGGSRAAYLCAAILREIHRSNLRINIPGAADGDLLQQLGVISAVSGGALSSAYFTVHKQELIDSDADSPAWDAYLDAMASNNRGLRLSASVVLDLPMWLKLLFTNYNRGHVARDHFDRDLFRGGTLTSLPERPLLLLNASNLTRRTPFVFARCDLHGDLWTTDFSAFNDSNFDDLTIFAADPATIRIADAVYASAAFPFGYPNLEIYDWGRVGPDRNAPDFVPGTAFLADGGLMDNSGMRTLNSVLEREVFAGQSGRLVLAILIDASIEFFALDPAFAPGRMANDEASNEIYIGQGARALEVGFGFAESVLQQQLEGRGWVVATYPPLSESIGAIEWQAERGALSSDAYWPAAIRSGQLAMWPVEMRLPLDQLLPLASELWAGSPSPRLKQLLDNAAVECDEIYAELPFRLAHIRTDFVLRDGDRETLDLCAYVLVHASLQPQLSDWNRVAAKCLFAAPAK